MNRPELMKPRHPLRKLLVINPITVPMAKIPKTMNSNLALIRFHDKIKNNIVKYLKTVMR